MTIAFDPPPADKVALEEGVSFTPKFDQHGLITAIVTDFHDGALLMVGHMNAEALALTLETGVVHYFSRSRGKLWKKGETSGNLQHVVEILTDCDQDALQVKVKVAGHDATCHTGRRSCFYRAVTLKDGAPTLEIVDDHRHFEPETVYKT
ncbi:phosphoribosyl-AMP cyclohydrolase [Rhizobium sp. SG_E_25_P2]|uniref:phosphoribosyl-AMP cyclohydrolase n=1 Tax=Rhizobium sp. SG_E_25_P2 TaxID=2879942 RepID=UPI00247516C6|nr:phosphoribosyl-AMP cyclohydrolase [Rhizobium sp. SG_E_25_P2]MDH6269007.1 phosphoribosyl-AMP cyclohydrolase [Rhizobium sp. SG_E_25_P2]